MKAADGGPAFPSKLRVMYAGCETKEFEPVGGMTLRDYFAAKAMAGMLANPQQDYAPLTLASQAAIVSGAYAVADAMLAARKGGAA